MRMRLYAPMAAVLLVISAASNLDAQQSNKKHQQSRKHVQSSAVSRRQSQKPRKHKQKSRKRDQRPKELLGSSAKLANQNRIAFAFHLDVMKNAAMIDEYTRKGRLVVVPAQGRGWYLDPMMGRDPACAYPYPEKLKRIRPWAFRVINREGDNFADSLPGSRFKLSGLVRTREYHEQLQECNDNAAKCKTALSCSPHLTGSAFDISKLGLSSKEIAFLRRRFIFLQRCGQISAMEERKTNSFHIFVRPDFEKRKKGKKCP